MHHQVCEISFEDCPAADANKLVQRLEAELREGFPGIDTSIAKENDNSQDFGTTLVLILGTPVAIALAKGIASFLQRNAGASIRVSTNGEIVARNLNSEDVARIVEALAKAGPPNDAR